MRKRAHPPHALAYYTRACTSRVRRWMSTAVFWFVAPKRTRQTRSKLDSINEKRGSSYRDVSVTAAATNRLRLRRAYRYQRHGVSTKNSRVWVWVTHACMCAPGSGYLAPVVQDTWKTRKTWPKHRRRQNRTSAQNNTEQQRAVFRHGCVLLLLLWASTAAVADGLDVYGQAYGLDNMMTPLQISPTHVWRHFRCQTWKTHYHRKVISQFGKSAVTYYQIYHYT